MPTKKHPTKALVVDLQAVFAKHNWSGRAIGLRSIKATAGGPCPEGTTPQEVTYKLPDGTWVNKTICV